MYTFRYGGKAGHRYQLVESPDLVVVRTYENNLENLELTAPSRALLPFMLPVSAFPEANVTIYKVLSPETGTSLTQRNTIRRQLPQEPGVRFAGRVLKESSTGMLYIYTENFFIKFTDACTTDQCEGILRDNGLELKESLTFAMNSYFAEVPEGTGLQLFELGERLLDLPEVELCHPELVQERRPKAVIDPNQWHLQTTRISGRTIAQSVNIVDAWKKATGAGVTIAVIDDGVDVDHPEFNAPGKVVDPRDTILNSDNARPKFSMENHGTACAGVACAAGVQASGVAPDARLMPIRSGGLGSISESKAFAWAADHGADVISCSWGPRDGNWWDPNDPYHTRPYNLPDSSRLAIDYAVNNGRAGKGCVIVWAAGNGNENVEYDGYASNAKVIAVAACNDRGRRSVYSDYGEAVWCAFPSSDIYTPQFNLPRPLTPGIWTTDRAGVFGYNPGGRNAEGDTEGHYTATFGGTSSACPGVAGIVALMLQVNPQLNWRQVKELLRFACDPIDQEGGGYDAEGHSLLYGYGRVNAVLAVTRAEESMQSVDVFGVEGVAFFNHNSTVAIREGQLTEDGIRRNRLVGLKLAVQPFHPDLGIRYRLFVNNQGPTPWGANGSMVGASDRRRKTIGLVMELTGPLAADYSVRYSAQLKGKNKPIVHATDGAICGTDGRSGKAIEEIKVEIVRRR